MKPKVEKNYLLEAVNKLTHPHKTRVMQSNDAGITCISEVEHDPLLILLRDAVAGGTGPHAGGTLGSERIPLNPTAMELFDDIAGQINAWYLALPDHREHRYINDRLTDWYLDYENRRRGGRTTRFEDTAVTAKLEAWAEQVEAMFDPPQVLELTVEIRQPIMKPKTRTRVNLDTGERFKEQVLDGDGNPIMKQKLDRNRKPMFRVVTHQPAACPVCGAQYAADPRTGDQKFALIVEYRALGAETLDKATGLCRACNAVWEGRHGVRELRWLIDNAEVDAEVPSA